MSARGTLAREAIGLTARYLGATIRCLTEGAIDDACDTHVEARLVGTAFGLPGVTRDGAVRERLSYDRPGVW